MSTLAEDIEFGHNLLSVLPSEIFRKMIGSLYVDSERQFFAICMNTGELDGTGVIIAANALAEPFLDNVVIRPTCTNKQLGEMPVMPYRSLSKAALNDPQEACVAAWKSLKENA